MSTARTESTGVILACSQCGQRNRVAFDRLDKPIRCGACKSPLALNVPVEVTEEAHFHYLVRVSPVPVLVDFWARWCGPCQMMAPEFEKAASRHTGELLFAKVNTDELPSVAQQYQISSIPTLILYMGGRETGRTMGARPMEGIEAFLAQVTP